MAHKSKWPEMCLALQQMVPHIEGKPCVYLTRFTRQVFVCRGLHDIRVSHDAIAGKHDWVDPQETLLDYLSEEFELSYDVLEYGGHCWYDNYFQAWYVFDPEMVERSMRGDHAWVGPYLGLDKTPFPLWSGHYPWHPPASESQSS